MPCEKCGKNHTGPCPTRPSLKDSASPSAEDYREKRAERQTQSRKRAKERDFEKRRKQKASSLDDDEELMEAEETEEFDEDEELEETSSDDNDDLHRKVAKAETNTFNIIPPSALKIYHIDVGQGEATLIHFKSSATEKVVLIDGGKATRGGGTVEWHLGKLGIKTIDAMICTHYDADHIEGLTFLLENSKTSINKVYCRGGYSPSDPLDEKVIKFHKASGSKLTVIKTGDKVLDLTTDGLTLKCVHVDSVLPPNTKHENNGSIALLLKFHHFTYYTAGDLESNVEDGLKLVTPLSAFKCGHHGSKGSTSDTFLSTHKPQVAFISSGKHSYCHPDDQLIDRLGGSDEVKRIFLTNCFYNRAGVNPDFEKREVRRTPREWMQNFLEYLQLVREIKTKPHEGEIIKVIQNLTKKIADLRSLALNQVGAELNSQKKFKDTVLLEAKTLENTLMKLGDDAICKKIKRNQQQRARMEKLQSLPNIAKRIKNQNKFLVSGDPTHLGTVMLCAFENEVKNPDHKFEVHCWQQIYNKNLVTPINVGKPQKYATRIPVDLDETILKYTNQKVVLVDREDEEITEAQQEITTSKKMAKVQVEDDDEDMEESATTTFSSWENEIISLRQYVPFSWISTASAIKKETEVTLVTCHYCGDDEVDYDIVYEIGCIEEVHQKNCPERHVAFICENCLEENFEGDDETVTWSCKTNKFDQYEEEEEEDDDEY